MNSVSIRWTLAALALGTLPGRAAVVVSWDQINQAIPDANLSGLADTRTLASVSGQITDLNVSLTLAGLPGEPSFNGDLYVTLQHDSGFTVLLNRVGRTETRGLGYADDGFTVTFDQGAANDVHTYRIALSGALDTPLAGPLTGVWQPDGRLAPPDSVLASSPRSAGLDSFSGLDPNGTWTLFLADLETGGRTQLVRWSLELTGVSLVPEPEWTGLGVSAGLLGWWGFRHSRARRKPSPSAP
ncbi:MAG: PEP-CTERM sorting domain-containing protein [Verrucomicrobiae bacterium]|nr:PEP-CTERM sorting domain-containing protein [Verrucomicrobiae bacterium]